MAFVQRLIKTRFILGQGDFGEGGADTVDLEGLRCSANIVKQGVGMAQLDLTIFGMSLSLMNKLTVLNKLRLEDQRYNQVILSAGDEKSGLAVAFQGTIREAWADGRQPPDVAFHVSADTALFQLIKPVAPISFKGSVDVPLVLSGIAEQMDMTLENNGVTGTLENPYWPGSLKAQLEKVCAAVHCEYLLDDASKTLAVWPKGKSRGGTAVLLNKDSGMVGYPAFTQSGIQVTSLYNPSLAFGRQIKVESDFTTASGNWTIQSMAHRLESIIPGGQWFTDMECSYLDHSS